jgi:hypothetical protein
LVLGSAAQTRAEPSGLGTAAEPNPPSPFAGKVAQAFRLRLATFVAPGADFDGADVTLVRPELQLRARLPLGRRWGLRAHAGFASSRYDVDDGGAFFRDCATCPFPDDLYSASLGLQAGYALNTTGYWFREGEQWAVLGGGFGRARWETGAFDDSMTGGGSLALGYQLPGRVRVALGARLEQSIEDRDPKVDPVFELRWHVTEHVRLRTRNVGLRLEAEANDRIHVFASAWHESDRFRLDSRADAPQDLTFRDRQFLVGGGLEWHPWRRLRLAAEAGAIMTRRISMSSEDDGKLDSTGSDPSPYFEVRIEVRP